MWIHGALLRRELLSIPRDIFKFLDWGGGRRCIWWKGARREAVAMAEAVAFMHADVCAPMAPVIFASDASLEGGSSPTGAYGIVASNVSPSLAAECAAKGVRPGFSVTRLDGSFTGTRRPEEPWRRRNPLSRLPREVLD